MPLPRLRVRTLMVAVAVAAGACGFIELGRRRAVYRARAKHSAGTEALIRGGAWGYRLVSDRFGREHRVIDRADLRALATYHAVMKRKYERAARYPWLPVAPDPPPPE